MLLIIFPVGSTTHWSVTTTTTDKVGGQEVGDANLVNECTAGEDFDHDMLLPNIDFGTYVCIPVPPWAAS